MAELNPNALQQLFTEARSFSHWLDKPIAKERLTAIYDLMKWGPTSANSCPLRIVFVQSPTEKAKLISCLAEANIEKVKTAPVTAILATDKNFYENIPALFPHQPQYRELFAADETLANTTAFRNSSLQAAYFMLAARALGLDCGPMSGFNNQKLDETFFKETSWTVNFICSLGIGDRSKLKPRNPRLDFAKACMII